MTGLAVNAIPDFGVDHDLHHHGHGHALVVDRHLVAVVDGLRCPQRRPAFFDRLGHLLAAPYVQVGFLLAGKGQVGQILGIGGRANGNCRSVWQGIVRRGDFREHLRRQCPFGKQCADTVGGLFKGHGPVDDRRPHTLEYLALQIVFGNVVAIGGSRDLEPTRDVETGIGKQRQGAALAADDFQTVFEGIERYDEAACHWLILSFV